MSYQTTITGYDEYGIPQMDTVWVDDPASDYSTPDTSYLDQYSTNTFTGGDGWVDNGNDTYSFVNDIGQTYTVDSYGNLISSPDTLAPSDSAAGSPAADWTAYGYTDNGDGTYNFKDSAGNTYTIDGGTGKVLEQYNSSGTSTAGLGSASAAFLPGATSASGGISGGGLSGLLDKGKAIWNGLDPKTRAALIGAGITGIDALTGGTLSKPGSGQGTMGFQGKIPTYAATRVAVPGTYDPNRRPGSTGQRYFSDMIYSDPAGATAAKGIATAQATELANQNLAARPQQPVQAAEGGLMPPQQNSFEPGGQIMVGGYAHGGIAGRYLQGKTDGMADKLPAHIDGKQPAKLSHGEFVIPADVVSHLGNGNSDAGAQKLYDMMAKIRKARTGTTKQGKEINPDKFTGGLAGSAYASGGEVQGFATGGTTTVPTGTTGFESNLSNWAGPYVTDMLGQAQAAANQPYQAYQGPLTAGPSTLQQQTSTTLQNTGVNPNYGKSFTDTGIQQQYMNPYLQGVLTPQLDEMRRQSQITQMGNDAKMVGAGAFGGSRQAILTAENQRNLLSEQDKAIGQGYYNAFTQGQQQFNTEQGQAQSLLNQKANVGATDQATQQAGITADINQFKEERDNPYKMLQFQQSMLQGLPVAAQNYGYLTPSLLQSIAGGASGAMTLSDILAGKTTTTP